MGNLSISIVINTLNRGAFLQKTLESLRWLKYPGEFEVVVVNGPSTDNSAAVLESWSPTIRVGACAVPNLSVSRNIGICMAQGDIVAFIDDDAIPEPEWLIHLAEAYEDPMVGAVGGFVFDHTGYSFQHTSWSGDRLGNADYSLIDLAPRLCFPQSYRFPYLLGCNASFRRQALLEIGGFDEEYEYHMDEIDVCLRIVDAGYIIVQLPRAYVHHASAPNNVRRERRVERHRYPYIKNNIYFMFKHGRDHYSHDQILKNQHAFLQKQRNEVAWAEKEQLMSADEAQAFSHDLERAVAVGTKRGLEGVADGALIDRSKLEMYAGDFLPFRPIENKAFRSTVFICRDLPAHDDNSAAPLSMAFAESLAAGGDIVHIITRSPDINRVEFINGVWLHRMRPRNFERTPDAASRNIPQELWNWSSTALAETKRIAGHRGIDAVEAPLWNCEGAAFLFDGEWPLVTNMQSPLRLWLRTHPENAQNEDWMMSVGKPLMEMEKELMLRSYAVRFSSSVARDDVEDAYGLSFAGRGLVSSLGSPCEMTVIPRSHCSGGQGAGEKKRTAIILMTHRFDRSILDEFQRILEGIGETDQAFILSDGSESPPDSIVPWLYTFEIANVSRRAARTVGNGVLHNNHLPWIDFFESHPGFEYYWIIEYDVKFAGPWSAIFDSFRDLPHDLLCTHLRPYSHEPEWYWWNETRPSGANLPDERLLRGFLPIARLSRKGFETLRDAVDQGLCGHFEGIIPTLFLNSGLNIADMGGNGPFVLPGFCNRFYTSASDPPGSLLGVGTFRFRPPIRFPRIMPGRLYHPVKPELTTLDVVDGHGISIYDALEEAFAEIRFRLSESASDAEGQVERLLQEITGLSTKEVGGILDELEQTETETMNSEPLRQELHELEDAKHYLARQWTMPYLVLSILDHCNLGCKGCDHFAAIAEERFVSLADIKNDLAQMAKILNGNVARIGIMGGEPLLHPELNEILVYARLFFSKARIQLVTNGILLLRQDEEFWRTCGEQNITIVNTKYPVNLDHEAIKQTAVMRGVKFEYYDGTGNVTKTSYKIPLDVEGRQDPKKNFSECFHAGVLPLLMEGKLYACTVAPNVRHFNKRFGTRMTLDEEDYLDIYRVKKTSELFRFLNRPKPFCRFCDVSNRLYGHQWERSRQEITEWVTSVAVPGCTI